MPATAIIEATLRCSRARSGRHERPDRQGRGISGTIFHVFRTSSPDRRRCATLDVEPLLAEIEAWKSRRRGVRRSAQPHLGDAGDRKADADHAQGDRRGVPASTLLEPDASSLTRPVGELAAMFFFSTSLPPAGGHGRGADALG
jgi:hypothetical protein